MSQTPEVNGASRPRATAKKSKNGRKVVAAVVAVAILAGGGGGGFAYYRANHQSQVNVYSMDDIAMTDYWGDQSESDGPVSAEDLQTVFLSSTQQLSEILVTQGQEVKVGDPLFTYDSTLTQLDLDRASLEIQQKQLDLEAAKKSLAVVKTYRAGVAIPGSSTYYPGESFVVSDDPQEEETYVLTPASGSGTQSDPFRYAWSTVVEFNGGVFDDSTLRELSQGLSDAYVTLQMPAGASLDPELPIESQMPQETPNQPETPDESTPSEEPDPSDDPQEDSQPYGVDEDEDTSPEESTPMTYSTGGGLSYSTLSLQIQCQDEVYSYAVLSMSVNGVEVTLSDPLDPPQEEPEETDTTQTETSNGYYDPGIIYTASEIAQMIAEAEQEVRGLELEIRQAQLDYEKLKKEADNNTVYSELDGTVVLLADDPDNLSETDPLVKVSAQGSYTITAVLGEFDLDGVSVGQTVDVTVYGTSYTSCQGVITWISEYPATSDNYYYYYGGGNSNISKYPFTVEVSGEENLNEGDYAEVYYSAEGEDNSGIYLQDMFIRSENGKSYVYVESDGKLEKRYVSTGMNLWGSYTEITSGLTMDDYVAFPYGTEVKEGAKTVESDISDLYSSASYY
jgi:multidrug efflux pump subunit AcrA (membrane-fusion protein)